jgi:hypothetical protein
MEGQMERRWTFLTTIALVMAIGTLVYACHEGNYSVPTILAGARAEEKAAGEASVR